MVHAAGNDPGIVVCSDSVNGRSDAIDNQNVLSDGAHVVAVALVSGALHDGGATVDATGTPYTGEGFIVGGRVPELVISSWFRYLPERATANVAQWVRSHPAPYYGSWDDGRGSLVFDAVDIVPHEATAIALGTERGQLAVWNMRDAVEVTIGG